ncbi:MAG: peptide deformylase [Parachlamydiales bacterium]
MKRPHWYLRFYGDPILRTVAKQVEKVTAEVQDLANLMVENLIQDHAAGMAAVQYGEATRLFVLRFDEWHVDGRVSLGTPYVFINPILSEPSKETERMEEGCVSIPGIRLPVDRPYQITVEALDINGEPFTMRPEGIFARGVMHENDHLNGQLIIDRTPPFYRKRAEPLLRDLKKRHSTG